jgi:hypothetical protein
MTDQSLGSEAHTDTDLTILAHHIDQARIRANSIETAAPQQGVYGDLSKALIKTLVLLIGEDQAAVAYQALLDGSSVSDAIKYAQEHQPADKAASPTTKESEVLP